ncbi:MAG TPA: TetR/AcrR family transcriptional regulator [Acidimicrobiales bacterium]|nr:TetR/AcrR family transcriptional regulator [Acidimicrobiales bacterium]HWI03774.1 TetR/AcrR family transcriptional regulator [Acidimicrobiales bacterium]
MITQLKGDRRRNRHAAKTEAILAAAWELAREQGLAGISLRALAARVDLSQPSLYSYFASKNQLYDLMFAQGNRQLLERLEAIELPGDPHDALKKVSRELVTFFTEDWARYQIMNQRTVPGFEPSEESYDIARRVFDWLLAPLHLAGVAAEAHIDLFVALLAGLSEAQLANEPTGDRWTRHVELAIDMLLREVQRS